MNRFLVFLGLLMAGLCEIRASSVNTNATTNEILTISPSSMPVAGGKATLTIGPLQRTGGVYAGDYQISVSPYFFKNEKGRLAIPVSDESLAEIRRGTAASIIGTATTSGQNGHTRPIEATATPIDTNHGTLKLWFAAGDRKMIFEPTYQLAGAGAAGGLGKKTETNNIKSSGSIPASHVESGSVPVKHP